MEWTVRDFSIFLSMSIAVIGMTYTFPALGLADATVSQPPEYSADASGFNFAGEFPENPGTPSRGTIRYEDNLSAAAQDNKLWLENQEVLLEAFTTSGEMRVTLTKFNGSADSPFSDSVQSGDATSGNLIIDDGNPPAWEVFVEIQDVEKIDPANDNYNYTVEYEVRNRETSDGGFISSIPVVGGVLSTGAQLPAMVGWGISVAWWFLTVVFEITANLVAMLYATLSFVLQFLSWIVFGYTAIITEIGGFAGLVLTLPLLLLWFETSKAILVGISLLPTT